MIQNIPNYGTFPQYSDRAHFIRQFVQSKYSSAGDGFPVETLIADAKKTYDASIEIIK